MFGKLGPWELGIVLVIVLLIFGVGRIGKLGKDLGTGIREFRVGLAGDGNEEEAEKTQAETTEEA